MKLEELFPIGSFINIPNFAESLGMKTNSFRIESILCGGMGGCIKIVSEQGRSFAMKVLLPEALENKESVARYYNELKKWRTFSMCSGVLEAMMVIIYNELPCIISPWMENGDLYSLMKIKERTVFYNSIYRIAQTLDWVYSNFNAIHRDLKPSNILIGSDYLPYIADWGLVKTIGNNEIYSKGNSPIRADFKTHTGGFVGTIPYSSPEQLLGNHDIDFRSDIFSLGIIMYEWETGKRPFDAPSVNETITNIIRTKYKKLGGMFSRSNFGTDRIINKCLSLNPDDRFLSYKEFLSAIEDVAKDTPSFDVTQINFREYSNLENPKSNASRIKEGDIHGKITEATNGRYILLESENIEEQITIASELLDLGEYEKAYSIFVNNCPDLSLVERFPNYPIYQRYIINYSWCLRKLNKIDEAISLLNRIGNASFLPPTYYINLSEFHLSLGKFKEGLQICNKGLEEYEKDGAILGNATLCAMSIDMYNEAIRYANRRIQCDPGLHAYYEYGTLCNRWADEFKETDFPQAIKLYKSALLYLRKAHSINPNYYSASVNLSIVLFKLKRYKDSLDLLYSIDRSEVSDYWIAKNMLWGVGGKECLDFCSKSLKIFPDSVMIRRVYSECMVDEFVMGKVNENRAHFIEDFSWNFFEGIINDKGNRSASDLRYYGKLLYWAGDAEESVRFFKWAEQNYPHEWTYNFHKSYYLLYLGNYTEALEEAIIANKKAPWRETTYKLLSTCCSYMGDTQMASKHMKDFEDKKFEKENLYASCISI